MELITNDTLREKYNEIALKYNSLLDRVAELEKENFQLKELNLHLVENIKKCERNIP